MLLYSKVDSSPGRSDFVVDAVQSFFFIIPVKWRSVKLGIVLSTTVLGAWVYFRAPTQLYLFSLIKLCKVAWSIVKCSLVEGALKFQSTVQSLFFYFTVQLSPVAWS